jgi:hypothetical protein
MEAGNRCKIAQREQHQLKEMRVSYAIVGPFAGGQEHVEDNRIVDRDLMRPKSFTRPIGS